MTFGVAHISDLIMEVTIQLLPPANEVWGKVMFSQVSVIQSTGGSASREEVSASRRRGVCIQEEGGVIPPCPPSDTTGYGQRAGGTHPTGIHSRFL